jgi:hypothetical protein
MREGGQVRDRVGDTYQAFGLRSGYRLGSDFRDSPPMIVRPFVPPFLVPSVFIGVIRVKVKIERALPDSSPSDIAAAVKWWWRFCSEGQLEVAQNTSFLRTCPLVHFTLTFPIAHAPHEPRRGGTTQGH